MAVAPSSAMRLYRGWWKLLSTSAGLLSLYPTAIYWLLAVLHCYLFTFLFIDVYITAYMYLYTVYKHFCLPTMSENMAYKPFLFEHYCPPLSGPPVFTVSSGRSQSLYSGLGAKEERKPVPPASGSWLLHVRHQEAAERRHRLHSHLPHQEVRWQPEAQTVPRCSTTGQVVLFCWLETGEMSWNREVCVRASNRLSDSPAAV